MKRFFLLFLLLCSAARGSFDDSILKDSANVTFEVLLRGDDDGQGETGETSATVTCYYMRQGAASAVEVSLITGTLGSHTDGGWIAVDATNMPGLYQFDAPDAAFATGVNAVTFMFTVSGVLDKTVKFALVDYDPRSATNLGLSNLDAAISSRSSHSAADVWTATTRTLTANTNLNDPTAAAIATATVALLRAVTPTAGGVVTYDDMWLAVYSMASGRIIKTGNVYQYFDDDDSTVLFTLTVSDTGRTN